MCVLAQSGDTRAADELVRRYEMVVVGEAGAFFLPGADRDDVRQEARFGVLKAIRLYDPAREVPFDRYVRFSVRRQLVAALKAAQRGKHLSLTHSARIAQNHEGEFIEILELLPSGEAPLADQVAGRDEIRALARKLRVALSAREAHCLILFANGYEYTEIARIAGVRSAKAVDIAINNARYKLRGFGPPSDPSKSRIPVRRVFVCPGCRRETVRVNENGQELFGPGRPPLCNVCTLRRLAA